MDNANPPDLTTTPRHGTEGDIHQKMGVAFNLIKALGKKTETESGPRFKYRSIDDIQEAIHEPLKTAGIFIQPILHPEFTTHYPSPSGSMVITEIVVEHRYISTTDGSYVYTICMGQGADTGDKQSNKGHTSAFKVSVCQTFNINGGGEDVERTNHDNEPPPNRNRPGSTNPDGGQPQNREPAQKPGDDSKRNAALDTLETEAKARKISSVDVEAMVHEKFKCALGSLDTGKIMNIVLQIKDIPIHE